MGFMRKRWITVFIAAILLIAGFIHGHRMQEMEKTAASSANYQTIMPKAASFEPITGTTARAYDANGHLIAYLGYSESSGYGGVMTVGTIVNPDGLLREPVIIRHNETLTWMIRVKAKLHQYNRLKVTGRIMPGYDLDAISGATLTTRAISDAVRESAHSIAVTEFKQSPERTEVKFQFGLKEIAVILLFALSIVVAQVNALRKFRLVLLFIGILILGVWLNRALSIVQFSSMFLGFLPSIKTNLLFYIIIAGVLGPIIFLGKNLYCAYVCPFCGILEILSRITGKNIPLGRAHKWLSMLRNILLFVTLLATMFTAKVNTIAYEPFGVIFNIDYKTPLYLWAILFAAFVSGAFFRRLWCVALCPAGAFLEVIRRLVCDVRSLILRKSGEDDED